MSPEVKMEVEIFNELDEHEDTEATDVATAKPNKPSPAKRTMKNGDQFSTR